MNDIGCLGIFAVWVLLPTAIAALVIALRARKTANELQTDNLELRRMIYELQRDVRSSVSRPASEPPKAAAPAATMPEPITPPPPPEVIEPPALETPVAAFSASADTVETPLPEPAPRETPTADAPLPPAEPAAPPPIEETEAAFASIDPPMAPPGAPRASAPLAAESWLQRIDWEDFIGVRLFSWIAGVAATLALVFFLKYTVESGWITPPLRFAIGLAFGILFLVLPELRAAGRYRITANAMDGAGVAILYATLFAGHAMWNLLSTIPTFALMAVVTAIAVALSVRRDSSFIALLGLLGGFATPAMLSTGEDKPVGLFSYLVLLNVGLAWASYRKRWSGLVLLSVIFTALYQWAWVVKFLGSTRLPLAGAIFLVFPIVGALAFGLATRKSDGTLSRRFEHSNVISFAMPLLFALYVAANPALGARYSLLFGFLLLVAIGIAFIAALRPHLGFLHVAAGLATIFVHAAWLSQSYSPIAYPKILFWVAAFALLYQFAPHVAKKSGREISPAAISTLFGALLLWELPALLYIERRATPLFFFAVALFLVGSSALSSALLHQWRTYFVATAAVLAAVGVWSAQSLTPSTLVSGVILFTSVALLLLAVPIVIRRAGIEMPETKGHLVLTVALLFLAFPFASSRNANFSLLAIAFLVALIFATVVFLGREQHSIWATAVAAVAAWLVLFAWWTEADLIRLGPGATIAAAFIGMAAVATSLLVRRGNVAAGDSSLLGLAAYFFLMALAADERLTRNAIPLIVALMLLHAATAIASYLNRTIELHVGASILATIVISIWQIACSAPTGPTFAALTSAALVAISVALVVAANSRAPASIFERRTAAAAVVSIFGLHIVLLAGRWLDDRTSFPLTLTLAVLSAVAVYAIARRYEWHGLVTGAAAPLALIYVGHHYGANAVSRPESFSFATLIFVLTCGYAVYVRERRSDSLHPHLAPVVASIPFFVFARMLLVAMGFNGVIGLLPLSLAAVFGLLLLHLLRVPYPDTRLQARLVLTAAAGLTWATVAIPLQFEKEWITVAWSLEAAALAWLFSRIHHRGLLVAISIVGALAFVRLTLNPAVVDYHPASTTPIWNWYLYTYGISAIAFFAASWLLRRADVTAGSKISATAATWLLFLLVNIEVADFYSKGETLTFNFRGTLAENLTYTIAWGVFAILMLIAGLMLHTRGARIAAIALLAITSVKCFVFDLAHLGGLYRVGSLIGLAICLGAVALLLQRFVLASSSASPPEPEAAS